jgi:hypothetical protein
MLMCREKMFPAGLEPPSETPENSHLIEQRGAKSGALGGESAPLPPELAKIIEMIRACPELLEADRDEVIAQIRQSAGRCREQSNT